MIARATTNKNVAMFLHLCLKKSLNVSASFEITLVLYANKKY